MSHKSIPTTEQIRAYLTAHDWRLGWNIGTVGAMYVYRDFAGDGNEITVFVPSSETFDDYAERVLDIGNTLKGLERRDREAVFADMLTTRPAAVPRTPPIPA